LFKKYDEIVEFCKEKDIKIIDFKIIDLEGRWHRLSIPLQKLDETIFFEGIGFDGSSYGFLTVEKSDMVFIPDISTAFMDPFNEVPTLNFIANIYRLEGETRVRFEGDPRFIAEKVEKYLGECGIADKSLLGPEFEFYVLDHISYKNEMNHMEVLIDSSQAEWNSGLKETKNIGLSVGCHGGYHLDSPYDSSYNFRNKVTLLLEENNVPVKYHHSENGGPGQVEIEVNFAPLLEMADRTMKLKYILKNAAKSENKTVTFMPKPFATENGSGMHIHIQLFKGNKPLFYDKKGYSCLSETAFYAIGGILKHAAAIMAFTNPSTNSYKRLVPGYEAPVNICFGTSNRSAVIRIPGYATSPDKKRFEIRFPDATCNPYLAFSAVLMAAIDGINNKIDAIKEGFGPFDINVFNMEENEKKKIKSLPHNLLEVAEALQNDYEFLSADKIFTKNLIDNQIKKIKKDHFFINSLPHPEEFKKYYNL